MHSPVQHHQFRVKKLNLPCAVTSYDQPKEYDTLNAGVVTEKSARYLFITVSAEMVAS